MAEAYSVDGPIAYQVTYQGQATAVTIGRGDNDDKPDIQERWHKVPLFSDEGGDVPEDDVFTGREALINVVMKKWDRTVWDAFLQVIIPNSAASGGLGDAGEIGRTYNITSDVHTFAFILTPAKTGQKKRTYANCRFAEDGIREFNFGNSGTFIALSIEARVDGSGDLYTEASIP